MKQGCPADSGAERDPRPDPGNTGVGSFTAEIQLILIAPQARAHPAPWFLDGDLVLPMSVSSMTHLFSKSPS